ncbi:hypothetical protein L3X38_026558 [Prunus dulcis]|uniref:Myb/SANT-like domain-containing protein n=1 Tax=Prunus dulcis TaxID=3755 RepID=A0AAD4VN17_PRUDU|nr:hypothetical protein L3X38_026558 [Prunus dulcis]
MERSLADILREERQIGHKGDGGWNAVAYNTVAAILSARFDIEVSADNIRNRVKTWKRFYGIVSDILSQSTSSTEGQPCKRGPEGRFAVPLRNSSPINMWRPPTQASPKANRARAIARRLLMPIWRQRTISKKKKFTVAV